MTTLSWRARRLMIGTTAAAVVLGATATAGASTRAPVVTPPKLTSLTLSRSTVPHAGGSVMLKAKVTHSSSCTISSSVSVAGLPKTVSCASGKVDRSIRVGAAPTAAARHVTFTLKAKKAGHSTSKKVTLTQSAEPAPTVSAFKASPTTVASAGGHVTLSATIARGATCKLSVAPALTGLPKATTCSGSSYSESVTLPADSVSSAHRYVFSLSVKGSGGAVTAAVHPMVTVKGAAAPSAVTSVSAKGGSLPANAITGDTENAYLYSVSCPAAGDCVAVGYYRANATGSESFNQEGLVETLSGTTWTPTALPLPSDSAAADPYVAPSSVSCWSPGNCVVVGEYYADSGYEPYVATQTRGGTWTWQTASVPAPPNATTRVGAELVEVSCGSDGGCAAVGDSQPASGEKDAIIEQPAVAVDGDWVGLEAPLPDDASPEGSNDSVTDALNAVSCVSTTSCSAVGSYTTGSGNQISDAEVGDTLSGTTWTAARLSPSGDSAVGDAIACGGTDCAGSGEFDSSNAYLEPEVSGVWQEPIATPAEANNGAGLEAASCAPGTGATACVLVGEEYPAGSSSATDGLIVSGSGDTYTDSPAPLPSTADIDGMAVLVSDSCGSAGNCGAVGYFTATDQLNNEADGLIDTESTAGGPTWTPTEAPNPSDAYSPGALKSISCVTGWGCAVVGGYQSTQDNAVPDLVLAPL